MPRFRFRFARRIARASVFMALLSLSTPAISGPIPLDTSSQFSFDAGVPAAGCDLADPAGAFCIPGSGTPSVFLDAPAWAFLAPTEGATLTSLDAFLSGFEVSDFDTSLGLTSVAVLGAYCGDDPVACLADSSMSRGIFPLGAGSHALTIVTTRVPEFGGTGNLHVAVGGRPAPVPEPGVLVLLSAGFVCLAVFLIRRSRSAARTQTTTLVP